MPRAKLFANGGSQAVRLPKEFRFEGEEVEVRKVGQDVIISPVETDWDAFFAKLQELSEGFMEDGRDQPPTPVESVFD